MKRSVSPLLAVRPPLGVCTYPILVTGDVRQGQLFELARGMVEFRRPRTQLQHGVIAFSSFAGPSEARCWKRAQTGQVDWICCSAARAMVQWIRHARDWVDRPKNFSTWCGDGARHHLAGGQVARATGYLIEEDRTRKRRGCCMRTKQLGLRLSHQAPESTQGRAGPHLRRRS